MAFVLRYCSICSLFGDEKGDINRAGYKMIALHHIIKHFVGRYYEAEGHVLNNRMFNIVLTRGGIIEEELV